MKKRTGVKRIQNKDNGYKKKTCMYKKDRMQNKGNVCKKKMCMCKKNTE